MAYINSISYYLPEGILTNEMLNERFPEWSADKISAKTGIYQRHIAAEDEFSSDLALKAAENLIAEYKIDKSTIDFLILCTQSPDYFLPTTACILQDKLGLSKTCGALDFNQGCSGYIYGLGLAKGLLSSGQAKNVLLITAETYSKFVADADKKNRTIFGDAAAASLISQKPNGLKIHDFEYGTDGSGADQLIVKEGGIRHRTISEKVIRDEYGNERTDAHLYMDGQGVFLFALTRVPSLVKKVAKKHDLTIQDIELFVFHQANTFMLEHLRKKLKITPERFFFHMKNCGNTVSSTIPIAIKEAWDQSVIKPKQRILIAGFGVGLSWGGTILEAV